MDLTTLCSGASLFQIGIGVLIVIAASFVVKRGVANQIIAQYKAAAESQAAVAAAATQLATLNAATCEALRVQIGDLTKDIFTVHQELGSLKKENEFLRERNIALQKEIAELREENGQLRDRLSLLENGAVKTKRGGKLS